MRFTSTGLARSTTFPHAVSRLGAYDRVRVAANSNNMPGSSRCRCQAASPDSGPGQFGLHDLLVAVELGLLDLQVGEGPLPVRAQFWG